MKNYFESIKTLQGVMAMTTVNRDKLNDGQFQDQFKEAWNKWRTSQVGKYGYYTAEPSVSPEFFLGVIDTVNKLERLPIYVDGKKKGKVALKIKYAKSKRKSWGLSISGDTKIIRQHLKDMGFWWDKDSEAWWCYFKAEKPLPDVGKSVKIKTEPKAEEQPKAEKPKTKAKDKPKKTDAKKAEDIPIPAEGRKLKGKEAEKAKAEFKAKATAKRASKERAKATLKKGVKTA